MHCLPGKNTNEILKTLPTFDPLGKLNGHAVSGRTYLDFLCLFCFYRFLITACSFKNLSFNFRMGISTDHSIIHETIRVIFDVLIPLVMQIPDEEIWERSLVISLIFS